MNHFHVYNMRARDSWRDCEMIHMYHMYHIDSDARFPVDAFIRHHYNRITTAGYPTPVCRLSFRW